LKTERVDFAVGDLVRHRASGQVGVITVVFEKCVNPEHPVIGMIFHPVGCVIEPTGYYNVSVGFNDSSHEVPLVLLEHVE